MANQVIALSKVSFTQTEIEKIYTDRFKILDTDFDSLLSNLMQKSLLSKTFLFYPYRLLKSALFRWVL